MLLERQGLVAELGKYFGDTDNFKSLGLLR